MSQSDKSVYQAFSSVQSLSHVQIFAIPWATAHQALLSIINYQALLKLISTESVMPSNHLVLCQLFLFLPQSFPASGSFLMSRLFTSGGQSIGVSASTSNEYLGLVRSPCSPRDSQESSPTPQFKSINSSALSFLYGPTHIHT